MNYLVTGANGFIGTYCRHNLNVNGVNFIYANCSNLNQTTNFEREYKNISEVLRNTRVDGIIHLASVIPQHFNEAGYKSVFIPNIEMMNNLYEFALERKIKSFTYISTFGSMKSSEKLDIKDYYTLSKITGELFCNMMAETGIAATCLRIPSPYGEYLQQEIFTKKALNNDDILIFGSGEREQNFIYVGDIMNAIKLTIENCVSGIYEIVAKKNTSTLQLAQEIISICSSESNIVITNQPDPQESFKPNYSYQAARKDLGFEQKFELRDGLTRFIQWYKMQ